MSTFLPTLGKVPSLLDDELTIKATATGITFLAYYDDETKKFQTQRRFRKRYTGSKSSAVDINGNLHMDGRALDKLISEEGGKLDKKGKGKKKARLSIAPCLTDGRNHPRTIDRVQGTQNPRKKAYSVNKKEVRQRMLGYINTQRGKKELYFWTVSFPLNTPDDVCYQAFNTWLTSLRKYKMLKEYIWVAERQDGKRLEPGKQATGTIHFHIAIPHYMNVQRANAMMRGTLKNLCRAGAIGYNEQSPQIKKYNGVDICKHKKTKRVVNFAIKKGSRALATYLTKYVTKNDNQFEHLAWHNSRAFSALFTGVTFTIKEFSDFGFGHFLNRMRVFKMRFAVFIPWLYGPPPLLEDHLFQLNSYIQSISHGS